DIAPLVRLPVGVRAEEDDLLGLESLRDLARVATDGRHRNIGRMVAVAQDFLLVPGHDPHPHVAARSDNPPRRRLDVGAVVAVNKTGPPCYNTISPEGGNAGNDRPVVAPMRKIRLKSTPPAPLGET